MTQTKEHHAHPACSDTQWGITSQLGLFIPMYFISKRRRWPGLCTRCQTERPDHSRHRHRNPPPLQQPPPILKQRPVEGRSDGEGKEEPLAMLKQTRLEWGLGYYTCQGDFFSSSPSSSSCWQTVDDHRHGGLSTGDQQRPEAKGWGGRGGVHCAKESI